jgi:hypothetical protein
MVLLLPACGGTNRGGGGADAGIDAPGTTADAPSGTGTGACYGPSGWQLCLGTKPTGQVQLQGTLDTGKSDASNPCLATQPTSWTATQPDACIVAGDTITVMSLRVTGTRPLVLVAQTGITVMNLLDVASHRAAGAVGGGSAAAGDCSPFGSNPDSGPPGAGGAGGSFMFSGGDGGTSDGTMRAGGRAASASTGAPARLRGGCVGQPGGGGTAGDGGAGGGAVYLVSAGTITLSGKIDVSGAGGAGRDAQRGGGGGGSGGMVVLHAASITTSSSTFLIAGGGGGGGGSSARNVQMATARGDDGHEPVLTTTIAAALGGQGGLLDGFNGGDGGKGYPAASNMMPGLKGEAGDTSAGGGGGGGGGGYIRSNLALGTAVVSPAPDIKP